MANRRGSRLGWFFHPRRVSSADTFLRSVERALRRCPNRSRFGRVPASDRAWLSQQQLYYATRGSSTAQFFVKWQLSAISFDCSSKLLLLIT